ncbi:MAG TPA: acyltransferase [Candidatus Acidoferrales bacterium]|nr:acyltransferase [Candidatus Acidoferrales bacterium]
MTTLARAVIADTAVVSPDATIGPATKVWHFAQVREGARVGAQCNVGKGAYIGAGVVVGDRCKIENNASLFEGLTVEDGVFIGPHVVFTNDRRPRATNPDGSLQSADDWEMGHSTVRRGASIGAGAIVMPGIEIGRHAMGGAGAVVTHEVGAHELVVGNPGRRVAWVCVCGRERFDHSPRGNEELRCARCKVKEVSRA